MGAETVAKQALDQALNEVPVDIVVEPDWSMPSWSSENVTAMTNMITDADIEGVDHVEVISRIHTPMIELPRKNQNTSFLVVGISDNSRIYDGLKILNGSLELKANETYVSADSPAAAYLELGDALQVNLSVYAEFKGNREYFTEQINIALNFKVAGFVRLQDLASKLAFGHYRASFGPVLRPRAGPLIEDYSIVETFKENLLILDWEKTFAGILDTLYALGSSGLITTHILVYIDRESVINPVDIHGSMGRIQTIQSKINNKVWMYGATSRNYLFNVLNGYNVISQSLRLNFIIIAIPVFFIAWYMGTTVSDVSFNLRRREIGLLLTKGFSSRQLLRMFLSESFLVGLIGGVLGVGLGFFLIPIFAGSGWGGLLSGFPVIRLDTFVLSVIFSVILAFLSVFRSARKASKLKAVDALREYQYIEEVKPYRRKWPWIALILGTYKIVTLILGINLFTLFAGPPPTYNIILVILLAAWIIFDTIILGYGIPNRVPGLGLGPVLFFWGLTKMLILGSLKFQKLTTKLMSFLGDLGSLATRNVQRNPARAASVAFLIALILGYSVQIIGVYSSERDFTVRQIRFEVGADVSVTLNTLTNLSSIIKELENLQGIESTTMEYTFIGQSPVGSLTIKAINPEKWVEIAYYEEELFTGSNVATALQQMKENNYTIILERSAASRLDLQVGNRITVTLEGRDYPFGGETYSLKIVGFFGSESQQTPYYGYTRSFWSYMPEGFYEKVKEDVFANGRILVKLKPGADGEAVAEQIRELKLDNVDAVYSVAEELEEWQSNIFLSGRINVQLLGVGFAVLAASLGTALVTLVSLKERRKEVSIMCVRGLSYKQLTTMLLAENLAIVVFAALLGAIGGLLIVRGNVAAANVAPFSYSPLSRHLVFPTDSLLILIACFGLVFASTIIPVITMAKRYTTRLERIVREA